MYEPREDSFLIKKHVKEFCNSKDSDFTVLDMGTGSGILAEEASKFCKNVIACDIDSEVINELKKKYVVEFKRHALRAESNSCTPQLNQYKDKNDDKSSHAHTNIKFLQTNLFSNLKKPQKHKFDLILFNPPYIPTKKNETKFIDLDGGKNGTQLIEPFLKDAKKYMKPNGKILLLTSSLNKHITTLFKKYNYTFKLIDKEKFAFEELFLWVLEYPLGLNTTM
jgi:release factor glutamine methyltransferase